MGTPTAAVKLPSLPPPTATPTSVGSILRASGNSAADADSGIGGRLIAPTTSIVASGPTAASAAIAASTAFFSPRRCTRTSTIDAGLGGHDVVGRAARATVGVTVVPARPSPKPAITSTWCAASISALTPFSGSSPACAARPVHDDLERAGALAAGLHRAARRRCGSSTSTAPQASARSSSKPVTWPNRPPRRR